MHKRHAPSTPLHFDEFFESGLAASASPFLTKKGRQIASFFSLKASIASALLFAIALPLSFFPSLLPLSNLFLIFIYFISGIPSFIGALEDLLDLQINIDVLMTLAAFLSVIIGSALEGALLLVLFSLSGALEETVTMKARGSLSSLKYLSPPMAYVISPSGTISPRSVKDIAVGTHILIKAGEIVPLDGIVIQGSSSVNLVHLTGENLPVFKSRSDPVPAGARNIEGSLTLEVTHTNADSTLARLIELITKAQSARPTLQRFVDKFSNRYATSIILFAFAFAIALPLFTSVSYLGEEGSVYRALAFLVAASPCAVIIAIPIAYLSALSVCAKRGILLKGSITLDALSKCEVLAFDKTGTLTTGKLALKTVKPLQQQSDRETEAAVQIALSLERGAMHPIAEALTEYGREKNIPHLDVEEFCSLPGMGLSGKIRQNGRLVEAFIGRPKYLYDKLDEPTRLLLNQEVAKAENAGLLLAALVVEGMCTLFFFSDTIRPQMPHVIEKLRKHFRVAMLTGDHKASAASVAKELGIEEYYCELTPEDKLNLVEKLSQDRGLAMIGDGINDAPALARATVGISMGKVGSRTAQDASDIILLHDNLLLLDWLMDKAKDTMRIVKQNLALASAVIVLATTPALYGLVPLWMAVILHEGGTVLVGCNGLRLLKK